MIFTCYLACIDSQYKKRRFHNFKGAFNTFLRTIKETKKSYYKLVNYIFFNKRNNGLLWWIQKCFIWLLLMPPGWVGLVGGNMAVDFLVKAKLPGTILVLSEISSVEKLCIAQLCLVTYCLSSSNKKHPQYLNACIM